MDIVQENTGTTTTTTTTPTISIMDTYLKKHRLDLKVLPNKNMIKLSDLTSSTSNTNLIHDRQFPTQGF